MLNLSHLHRFKKITRNCNSMSTLNNIRSTAASGSQVYESERAVHEYLLLHFGRNNDLMPYSFGPKEALSFPQRCAQLCIKYYNQTDAKNKQNLRALDVGCAVGGASFELSKRFHEVVGIDFSQHFINAANDIKNMPNDKTISFNMLKSGSTFQECQTEPFSDTVIKSRCEFYQGDACNLDPNIQKFDVILASNLLCRLPNPRKFVKEIPSFLNENGILVLISPYSWLEEYTPKNEWFGENSENDSENDSSKVLHKFLTSTNPEMNLIHNEDISFLIREHARKFQYGVSDVAIYKKVTK